jgi:hypothetical protein
MNKEIKYKKRLPNCRQSLFLINLFILLINCIKKLTLKANINKIIVKFNEQMLMNVNLEFK